MNCVSLNQNKGFFPENDAIPQCRFRGKIAGTRNLDRIAIACYSEFRPELPHCLGEVYALVKIGEKDLLPIYREMKRIQRTNPNINNPDKMRYGGCLNFDDKGNLYLATQTQGNNVAGDT